MMRLEDADRLGREDRHDHDMRRRAAMPVESIKPTMVFRLFKDACEQLGMSYAESPPSNEQVGMAMGCARNFIAYVAATGWTPAP
jgi:hypothetical protein